MDMDNIIELANPKWKLWQGNGWTQMANSKPNPNQIRGNQRPSGMSLPNAME
jgi:hypothetical protein